MTTASSSYNDDIPGRETETGETGETGVLSNGEFITALFRKALPENIFAAVCTKAGDPEASAWPPGRWTPGDDPGPDGMLNAYLNCGVFRHGKDGSFRARKDRCAGVMFLMLDDVGTKVPRERFEGVEPTWMIETSPGNFQVGLAFEEPIDADKASAIHQALISSGLCDEGASQPKNRWARLPHAINGKPKHMRDGQPWRCRLATWNPDKRFTPEELVEAFTLELSPAIAGKRHARKSRANGRLVDPVFIPAADENPVIAALKTAKLYKTPLGGGKHDVTCPWVSEHTDAKDGGAAYFEPTDEYPVGGFSCQHSHGNSLSVGDLLAFLEVTPAAARDRPVIRVTPGSLARIVDAAELLLASGVNHFQMGGVIVTIATDTQTYDPKIVVVKPGSLLCALSAGATWERYDGREKDWVLCDPPPRHLTALFDRQQFQHLPRLTGLARQPFFAEDGGVVTKPGYHADTERFGVFNPRDFAFPEAFSREAAERALALLLDLVKEFSFVSEHDRAAAIVAMVTASVRASLPVAPAFHIRAPEYGSGKSYLAELIALFAGPAGKDAAIMSYPATSEEATKAMLAVLLTGPAAIIFDDMTTDWIPHGAVNKMLTSPRITERILGESRVAGASTRTLVLGTGNNVGPTRDLLRRVLTINVDHGTEVPATKAYGGDPVAHVTRERGRFVTAALTIVAAWRAAGSPKTDCKTPAGYACWSDTCRQPLLWLGLPDPALALFAAMEGDEERDHLAFLLAVWLRTFAGEATTVRKLITRAADSEELREAIDDLGVIERGEINRNRLGWALKRAEGRVANGYKLTRTKAVGRTAWRAVKVAAPVSPVSPGSYPEAEAMSEDDDAVSGRHSSRADEAKSGKL